MELTVEEAHSLFLLHLNAKRRDKESCAQAGISQYQLPSLRASLQKLGIFRPSIMFDSYSLGLHEYSVYFSIATHDKKYRIELAKVLRRSARIIWFAELGGRFQYAFTLVVKHAYEVISYLEGLQTKFSLQFTERTILQDLEFVMVSRTYLWSEAPLQLAHFVRKRAHTNAFEAVELDKKNSSGPAQNP